MNDFYILVLLICIFALLVNVRLELLTLKKDVFSLSEQVRKAAIVSQYVYNYGESDEVQYATSSETTPTYHSGVYNIDHAVVDRQMQQDSDPKFHFNTSVRGVRNGQ